MQVQDLIKHFQLAVDKGWLKPEDEVIVQWWAYEDVLSFVEGDENYGEFTDEMAREVWADVVAVVSRYDSPDNDVVRDEISAALDKRMGAK